MTYCFGKIISLCRHSFKSNILTQFDILNQNLIFHIARTLIQTVLSLIFILTERLLEWKPQLKQESTPVECLSLPPDVIPRENPT